MSTTILWIGKAHRDDTVTLYGLAALPEGHRQGALASWYKDPLEALRMTVGAECPIEPDLRPVLVW